MNRKKIITWLAVIFVVYTVITAPDRSADLVQQGFDRLASWAQSLQSFVDALVK